MPFESNMVLKLSSFNVMPLSFNYKSSSVKTGTALIINYEMCLKAAL